MPYILFTGDKGSTKVSWKNWRQGSPSVDHCKECAVIWPGQWAVIVDYTKHEMVCQGKRCEKDLSTWRWSDEPWEDIDISDLTWNVCSCGFMHDLGDKCTVFKIEEDSVYG